MYINIYIYIYIHTCTYTHNRIYMCIPIRIHCPVFIYTHIHIHIHIQVYIYIDIYIYTYVHIYIHIYMCFHTYMYVYIHVICLSRWIYTRVTLHRVHAIYIHISHPSVPIYEYMDTMMMYPCTSKYSYSYISCVTNTRARISVAWTMYIYLHTRRLFGFNVVVSVPDLLSNYYTANVSRSVYLGRQLRANIVEPHRLRPSNSGPCIVKRDLYTSKETDQRDQHT